MQTFSASWYTIVNAVSASKSIKCVSILVALFSQL